MCDDYYDKKCDCTVFCKKTVKYLSQFVQDDQMVAEIEEIYQMKN